MNIKNGVFTAINQRANLVNDFSESLVAYEDNMTIYFFISLKTSLRLKVETTVDLWTYWPGKLFEGGTMTYNYFTGWLVEEDV